MHSQPSRRNSRRQASNAVQRHEEFEATTDKATPINLAHHSFFNLKGSGDGDILGHVLTINGYAISPVNEELIPGGEVVAVDHTPFDFRKPHAIGERIESDDLQLQFGHGYDHNWVLDVDGTKSLSLNASVFDPVSGTFMEVLSDQPGLQFYSGNFFGDGKTSAEKIITFPFIVSSMPRR